MTDYPTPSKRRADFPDTGPTVDALRPRDPWDPPADPAVDLLRPGRIATEAGVRDVGPIAEALGYASDRLDLIEHKLGDLNGVLERLGHNLRPVLAADDGAMADPHRETFPEDPEAVDRRSTVARRIAALGHRADDLASIVGYLRAKVEQLDDALELDGVGR